MSGWLEGWCYGNIFWNWIKKKQNKTKENQKSIRMEELNNGNASFIHQNVLNQCYPLKKNGTLSYHCCLLCTTLNRKYTDLIFTNEMEFFFQFSITTDTNNFFLLCVTKIIKSCRTSIIMSRSNDYTSVKCHSIWIFCNFANICFPKPFLWWLIKMSS